MSTALDAMRATRAAAGSYRYAARPPRLVLRFAVITAACLGLGAAAILGFVRHTDTQQAERAAAARAQLGVDALLADALQARDLLGPTGERRAALLAAARPLLEDDGVLVTASYRGRIFWGSDGGRPGAPEHADVLGAASADAVTSSVATVSDPARPGERVRTLRTTVPISLGGERVAVSIYQDYGPIQQAAREAFLPVAGILELVLVVLFLLLVPLLARATRRIVRQFEQIRRQAYHDDLTGLPNRPRFRDAVAEAAERAADEGLEFAVLLVDLDRFKEVNDALGHGVGDDLLVELAERLAEAVPDAVLLARLGGDEFGLVLPDAGETEAVALAEAVRELVASPFLLGELPVRVEGSVGVALGPCDGADADTLLRRADVAMYTAKDRRVGVVRYEEGLDTSSAERLALMSELGRALDEGQLVLYAQPQVRLADGAVIAAEALVRWDHPTRGLLGPGAFVPFAERTGLGRRLSSYVLAAAVRELAQLEGEPHAPERLAVNLSMVDLLDLELPDEVGRLLAAAGVPPERLELEITEGVIMADPVRVRTVLERLRLLGVTLAIDDFGTGYSSLAYLKSLPVDLLKIDRSFVSGLTTDSRDAAVVRSAVELAHTLGLEVVAEGVEDAETYEALREIGCELAQGFHISRPVPTRELTAAARAWAAGRRERVPALPV